MADTMKQLKPTLVRWLESYQPLKQSSMISILSFIFSTGLHVFFFALYHKYASVKNMVPSFLKSASENEKLKLETVLFYDDTKGEKPHSKSIDKHRN